MRRASNDIIRAVVNHIVSKRETRASCESHLIAIKIIPDVAKCPSVIGFNILLPDNLYEYPFINPLQTARKEIKTKQTISKFSAFKMTLLFFTVDSAIDGINETPTARIIISAKLRPKMNWPSPANLNKYAAISDIESKETTFTTNLFLEFAIARNISKTLIKKIIIRYDMVTSRESNPMKSGINDTKPNPPNAKTKKYSLT